MVGKTREKILANNWWGSIPYNFLHLHNIPLILGEPFLGGEFLPHWR